MLPIGHLFSGDRPSWNTVFYHYHKWSVKEEWQKIYSSILKRNKTFLDLSIAHIEGSHTPACRGGEKGEYQGRKKRTTTNALLLSDNQGIPLAMAESQVGNHVDIAVDSLFCHLEAGFDSKDLKNALFSHGITPNVCQKLRNGSTQAEDFSMMS